MGRVIFGFGGELVEVAHQNLAVKWFSGQLGLAFGLGMSFSRIGSAGNSYFTPKLYEESGSLNLPLMVSFIICGISWLFGLFVIYFDYKSDQEESIGQKIVKQTSIIENVGNKICDIKAICRFEPIFWLLVINSSLSYGCAMGFLNISNAYVSNQFGFNTSDSGNIITLYYLVSMVLTPIFGKLVDHYGKRMQLMILAILIFAITQVGLTLIPSCNGCSYPIFIFIILGIFISIYGAVFWPSVALVVDRKYIGLAIGVIYSSMNFFMIFIPIGIGKILDNFDYYWVNIFLIFLASISLSVGFIIKRFDENTGRRLASMIKIPNILVNDNF